MQQLKIGTLQWSIGSFCLFIGAAMLVVPHQFRAPSYAALQPHLSWWGIVFLAAGFVQLAAAALLPQRRFLVAAHAFVGIILLMLAYGFAKTSSYSATTIYLALGLGMLLAPLLSYVAPPRSMPRGYDLFAILMGVAAVLTGLAMLLFPSQYDPVVYAVSLPYLHWYGLAFAACGTALVFVHLRPTGRVFFLLAHLLLAAVFYSWMIPRLGARPWTGIAVYMGLGGMVALLPWLEPRLRSADPLSLRMRFGLVLAVTAALPLLLVTLLVADQEKHMMRRQALLMQERLAGVLAQDVSDYIGLHRAALTALADQPGLLELSIEEQTALLRSTNRSYPDATAFALYSPSGDPLARSDGHPGLSAYDLQLFQQIRDTGAPALDVRVSRVTGRPAFFFGAPIRDASGRFAGMLTASIESSRVIGVLGRASISAGDDVFLVDEQGRVIAHPDPAVTQAFTDLSQVNPVKVLLASRSPQGSLSYGGDGSGHIAGFARVPKLGWGVVVERSSAVALAGIYTGLDLTFGILLLLTASALLVGSLAARSLTAPLAMLARATQQFAAGNDSVPLPRSGVSEVGTLATAFGEMRDRLALRTSERDRAEDELRRSEEQLRLITDALPVLISYIDRDHRYRFNNRSYEQWFGRPRSQITGEPVGDVLGQEAYELIVPYLEAALAGRESSLEVPLSLRGGEARDLQMTYIPHRNVRGEIEGCITLVADITAQKNVERQLREETESLETINRIGQLLSAELDLERLVQAVADAGTSLTGAQFGAFFYNLIDTNGESYTLYTLSGVPIEAFAGFPMPRNTKVFGPTFRGEGVTRIDDVKADPRYGHNPPYSGMPEGHLPVTSYLAVPVVSRSGEVLGGLFFGHPEPGVFSERAERIVTGLAAQVAIAMDNARLFQSAQEAIQARDQFLSVAAHELKTPTTSLLGYAQLLERRAEREGSDGRELRTLGVLSNQARRLHRLMLSLLDLSRLQTGQFVIEPGLVNISTLAARVIEELQPTVERHSLHLSDPSEQMIVSGDELRLEQVLYNLVQNAIKYSPEGGEVYVDVRRADGEVSVAVTDEGMGIPSDALPKLFSRFYRATNVNTQQISGMGLGLYVVREIVTMHSGRIAVESVEGQGSTFVVSLPLYEGELSHSPSPDSDGSISDIAE